MLNFDLEKAKVQRRFERWKNIWAALAKVMIVVLTYLNKRAAADLATPAISGLHFTVPGPDTYHSFESTVNVCL